MHAGVCPYNNRTQFSVIVIQYFSPHRYPRIGLPAGTVPALRITRVDSRRALVAPVVHARALAILRLSARRTASTTKSTTEARLESTRRALLALASIPTPIVATLALATGTATATASPLVTGKHAAWWGVGALLLDVGLRHDFGGEMEPLAEVVETLGRQGVVVPLPGELRLDVAAGGEGLHCLDNLLLLCEYNGRCWDMQGSRT
jgi:hypothetical protein